MSYRISYTPGVEDRRTFDSIFDAIDAIEKEMGWADAVCSDWFSTGDGSTDACCVYETEEECVADDEGAYAPRIIRGAVGDKG